MYPMLTISAGPENAINRLRKLVKREILEFGNVMSMIPKYSSLHIKVS
jgi:hypothetical protein